MADPVEGDRATTTIWDTRSQLHLRGRDVFWVQAQLKIFRISGRRPSFKVSLRSEYVHGPKVTLRSPSKVKTNMLRSS